MSTFIKVKKIHPGAVIPTQEAGDVGWDLTAVDGGIIPSSQVRMVSTGLMLAEQPYGDDNHKQILLKIEGRSGLAFNLAVFPIGGIIDPSYRGELKVMLYNGGKQDFQYHPGDRVAQIVIYPVYAKTLSSKTAFLETASIRPTERGARGFGSSGR